MWTCYTFTEDSHNTGNFIPFSYRIVCGFFKVTHWTYKHGRYLRDGTYGLKSLSEKTWKSVPRPSLFSFRVYNLFLSFSCCLYMYLLWGPGLYKNQRWGNIPVHYCYIIIALCWYFLWTWVSSTFFSILAIPWKQPFFFCKHGVIIVRSIIYSP